MEVAEQSLASTTQLYNPQTAAWSEKLISTLGLSRHRFSRRSCPAARCSGRSSDSSRSSPSLAQTQVVATCSHDTGAAVAAVPGDRRKLGLSQFGHLVAARRGTSRPDRHRCGARSRLHQRSRPGRHDPFPEKYRRPLGPAGMPPRVGSRRANLHLRRTDAARRGKRPGHRAHLARGRPLSCARRHAGKDRRVLPRNRPARSRHHRAIRPHHSRKPRADLRADPAPTRKSGRSQIRNSSTSSAAAAAATCSTNSPPMPPGLPVITGPVEATAIGNILIQALALGHLESPAICAASSKIPFPRKPSFPARASRTTCAARFQKLQPLKS